MDALHKQYKKCRNVVRCICQKYFQTENYIFGSDENVRQKFILFLEKTVGIDCIVYAYS